MMTLMMGLGEAAEVGVGAVVEAGKGGRQGHEAVDLEETRLEVEVESLKVQNWLKTKQRKHCLVWLLEQKRTWFLGCLKLPLNGTTQDVLSGPKSRAMIGGLVR
jgi:hypothetical protein